MNETDKAEFHIEVSTVDATEEELDRMTRQLLSELRELNVESAELAKGDSAPSGTKSADPVMIGNIAIAVTAWRRWLPKTCLWSSDQWCSRH